MFDKFKSSQITKQQQGNLKGGATGPYKAARDNAYAGGTTGGHNEGDLDPDNGPNGGS